MDDRQRTETGEYVETVTEPKVLDALESIEEPVATATEIGDVIGCTGQAARKKLHQLHENSSVERKKAGARAVVWWPANHEREETGGGTIVIECDNCGREESYPRTRCLSCGSETTSIDDDWRDLTWFSPPGEADDRRTGSGLCAECVGSLLEEAKEVAREKGRVPCRANDHNTHELFGKALNKCRSTGNVPFNDDEFRELREAYHSVRERVCPECDHPEGEIDEATIEAPENGTLSPDPPTVEYDGLRCACGWEGFEPDLSYRKQ